MNIELKPEDQARVESLVAQGRFESPADVITASIQALVEDERWKANARAKIARGLEDMAAGRVVDGETAMKRIRAAATAVRDGKVNATV